MNGDDLAEEMKKMLQGAAMMSVVDRAVQTYDNFAMVAMSSLVRMGFHEPEELSELSWKIADAMVAERRKRGLGGSPLTSATPTEGNG